MLAMLTNMHEVPHRHIGLPGTIRNHTMIYTVVIAMTLTILFDLSRIAVLGATFYLIMDIAIHWGILRHLRGKVGANRAVVVTAIVLDVVVLGAFFWIKVSADPLILIVSAVGLALIVTGEWLYIRSQPGGTGEMRGMS